MLINNAVILGQVYPINTDFKVAIECDKVLHDPNIDDVKRGVMIVTLLFGHDAPYCQEALDKAQIFLQGGSEPGGKDNKRLIDFTQHWDLIYSAFKAQYGIDLHEQDLHYGKFLMLLKGVKNQALSDVIELLNTNLSEIKDFKQRAIIKEAQDLFKIKEVKKEKRNEDFLKKLSQ